MKPSAQETEAVFWIGRKRYKLRLSEKIFKKFNTDQVQWNLGFIEWPLKPIVNKRSWLYW